MTVPNTILDDLAHRILLERQIKALFGVDSPLNYSSSQTMERLTTFSAVNSKPKSHPVTSSSLVGMKRKLPSSDVAENDLESLPSLELEDDVSDLEECDSQEDVAVAVPTNAADSCDSCDRRGPKRRKVSTDQSDLIVVLDMDECLIHFKMQDENELTSDTKNSEDVLYIDGNEVLLRPGLVDFLKYVTTRFQTHIFTAGTKGYADAILDRLCTRIGNEKAFTKRWYRDDCDTIDIFTSFGIDSVYVKPLSKVAKWAGRDDLKRIVHIDDQPKNFLLNHGNGIRVSEWRGTDPDDKVLENVTMVLKRIDSENFGDVRPHLRSESYLALKDHLSMMHLFPHRRTQGIGATLL